MMNTFTDLNIFSSELESSCAELVEHELVDFFNLRSKSASIYSSIVAGNFKVHSKDNFEKMILNYDELIILLKDIIYKLNNLLNSNIIYEEDIKMDEKILCLKTLTSTVIQNKTTHSITVCCEKIIDKAALESLKQFHLGLVSNYLLSKVDIGALILGNNNKKSMVGKYEKEIYSQIEGVLMNIKMDIRNLILKTVIDQINNYFYDEITA